MSDFKVNLDLSSLTQYLENFAKEVTKDLQTGIKGLAQSAHVHILQQAKQKMQDAPWDLKKYEENLSQAEQINDYLWEITLAPPAGGIENGRDAWDMKGPPGGLLHTESAESKGKIHTTKDGRKYRIVPFKYGEESKSLDVEKLAEQEKLLKDIKNFLKTPRPGYPKGVPLRKLELDANGSPRIGRLHAFNIPSEVPGKGNTPQLHGLTIHQTKNEKGKVKRTLTTFRTAIEGDGKWEREAMEGHEIFKDTAAWAIQEWEQELLPKIMEKYKGR